jgi:hypothetical protein
MSLISMKVVAVSGGKLRQAEGKEGLSDAPEAHVIVQLLD